MAGNADRRAIAPLLLPHFPSMVNATSNDWHGFLNAVTALDVDIDEPNTTAFDKWRQALAADKGLPVWGYTQAKLDAIKFKGEELKALEDKRVAAEPARLAQLAQFAPTKTTADLIKDAWKGLKK